MALQKNSETKYKVENGNKEKEKKLLLQSNVSSVAAMKLSSKYHAKVSRNVWHESLNLFDETFP